MRRILRTDEKVLLARGDTSLVELLEHHDSGGVYRRYVIRRPGKADARTPLWAGRRLVESINQGDLFE